jgi:uncharacterized protein YjbI with pentapeptide repeats
MTKEEIILLLKGGSRVETETLNLSGVDLSGANLRGANLSRATLPYDSVVKDDSAETES